MLVRFKSALSELDNDLVDVDGVQMKPSQCYHIGTDPAHVLFNTNCPENLKKRVQAILDQYMPHASRPQQ